MWLSGSNHNNTTTIKALLIILSYSGSVRNELLLREYLSLTHDVDNLYVVDGSFFRSSAAVNPTLTIIANALRVGDRLIERLAWLV